MPGFNGTGPAGIGPMTGGGMGYCVVSLKTPEEEVAYLKSRAYALEIQLKQIKKMIEELEKVEKR